MKMKKMMCYIAMGVGGTLLYQQIRNGNARRYLKDMENMLKDEMDDLEDMMQKKTSYIGKIYVYLNIRCFNFKK